MEGIAAGLFVYFTPDLITNPILAVLTASRLPQLIRTWMNRHTVQVSAVSLSSMLIQLSSTAFWLAFAILTDYKLIVVTSVIFTVIVLSTYIIENHIAKMAAKMNLTR